MDFSLFRIKVIEASQRDAFVEEASHADVLLSAIRSRPTAVSRRGFDWHIGNLEEISPTAMHFALGRTARATLPVRDPTSGDFDETEFESAPYTHVFLDVVLEVCAIAHKTNLSPTVEGIARQLQHVLNASELRTRHGVDFLVSPISEPEHFLRELREAYAITGFTVYFTRPNPFDVEGDFLKPMERLTAAAEGTSGSTSIRGDALDREPLEELTRSAAATGDNATARIRTRPRARPVGRSLRGATAKLSQESVETREEKLSFIERLRAKYHHVRGTLRGETP